MDIEKRRHVVDKVEGSGTHHKVQRSGFVICTRYIILNIIQYASYEDLKHVIIGREAVVKFESRNPLISLSEAYEILVLSNV